MGIKGLWKEVAPAVRTSHLSDFKGQRIGVDAYCWLHRAAVASAKLLQDGQPCEKFIAAFMARVDLAVRCGVTPILVFDGKAMPMKSATDGDRQKRREAAKIEADELMAQGRHSDAAKSIEKALEVTSEMAFAILQVAKERGVVCYVAPFEADAQLAFLCKEGVIQAVISEDSDLLVYNCPVLIAKLDSHGACDTIRLRDLPQIQGFAGLSYEAFMLTAILSGCDYVNNLPGVGIKTALRAVAAAASTSTVVQQLSTNAGLTPREQDAYEEAVHKAFYCFAHHLVYNPFTKQIEPFNPFPTGVHHRVDLIGAVPPNAIDICERHTLDPETGAPYEDVFSTSVAKYWNVRRGVGQRTLTSMTPQESNHVLAAALKPRIKDRTANSVSAAAPIAAARSRFFTPGPSSESRPSEVQAAVVDTFGMDSASQLSENSQPSRDEVGCPRGSNGCGTVHSILTPCVEAPATRKRSPIQLSAPPTRPQPRGASFSAYLQKFGSLEAIQ